MYIGTGIMFDICYKYCPNGFEVRYYDFADNTYSIYATLHHDQDYEKSRFYTFVDNKYGVILDTKLMAIFELDHPSNVKGIYDIDVTEFAKVNDEYFVYTSETFKQIVLM